MQDLIHQSFSVQFEYSVFFTEKMLALDNVVLAETVHSRSRQDRPKMLTVIDAGLISANPDLPSKLEQYAAHHQINLVAPPMIVPGGEAVKNEPALPDNILQAIDRFGICRHSYVLAVGGGAVLDMVGLAAATAHRGVRLIRVPTTVLAQNDAGIGVKNGINAFGKKNFIGTFCPPYAVINDFAFLQTLDMRDWRAGVAEAVKIALIRDAEFFHFLEDSAHALAARDHGAMKMVVRRCAELHLRHIRTAGDPFELGSARPLDFGHWAAHRLEILTSYELKHGEAVAIGIALDSIYSHLIGCLDAKDLRKILAVLNAIGFRLYVPEIEDPSLFEGLAQFREHLGGVLTVTLLDSIGRGFEVHEIDQALYARTIKYLKDYALTGMVSPPRLSMETAGVAHAHRA
jgi:3-dehydroquinate synthase